VFVFLCACVFVCVRVCACVSVSASECVCDEMREGLPPLWGGGWWGAAGGVELIEIDVVKCDEYGSRHWKTEKDTDTDRYRHRHSKKPTKKTLINKHAQGLISRDRQRRHGPQGGGGWGGQLMAGKIFPYPSLGPPPPPPPGARARARARACMCERACLRARIRRYDACVSGYIYIYIYKGTMHMCQGVSEGKGEQNKGERESEREGGREGGREIERGR
jgi:hypothetical protein